MPSGSTPTLDDEAEAGRFLDLLEGGTSVEAAAAAVGLKRSAVYDYRRGKPEFCERMLTAMGSARRVRSEELISKLMGHLGMALDQSLFYETDEDGGLVLDDELEPVPRTSLDWTKIANTLAALMKTAEAGRPTVATQVNVSVNSAPGEPLTDEQITLELEAIS